jgi:hypothetical protein
VQQLRALSRHVLTGACLRAVDKSSFFLLAAFDFTRGRPSDVCATCGVAYSTLEVKAGTPKGPRTRSVYRRGWSDQRLPLPEPPAPPLVEPVPPAELPLSREAVPPEGFELFGAPSLAVP